MFIIEACSLNSAARHYGKARYIVKKISEDEMMRFYTKHDATQLINAISSEYENATGSSFEDTNWKVFAQKNK